MAKLSRNDEDAILDALTGAGALTDEETIDIIRRVHGCQRDEAKDLLNEIYVERQILRAVSEVGGALDARAPMPVNTRWRWVRT